MAKQPDANSAAQQAASGEGVTKRPVRPNSESQQPVAQAQAAATSTAEDSEELYEEEQGVSILHEWLRDSPSWLTSLIVHMVILLALALYALPVPVPQVFSELTIGPNETESEEELEEFTDEEFEEMEVDAEVVTELQPQPETSNIAEEVDFSPAADVEAAAVSVDLSDIGELTAPKNDLMREVGSFSGTGLSGRGKQARQALVRKGGGSASSEQAVGLALQWLAGHQLPDGGWALNHTVGPGVRSQKNPGHKESRNGATALALLPFLGAGQTHTEGNYKKVVKAGLAYLVRSMKVNNQGGSLWDKGGNMYAHGLGAIALCEAYGMTKDKGLAAPAQAAINYICYAQDPVGGGWRYNPRQKGDTSAVGWQLMALKSGHLSYLNVPGIVVQKADRFLDSVQTGGGSAYGYVTPGNGAGTTAVGLLSRMYLGWKKDNPALERGVARFAKGGHSKADFYYNYYAMQVMFQASNGGEGEVWKKWNTGLRDYLVNTQGKQGAEKGSWYVKHGHVTHVGGRLYCTAMATMTLEVYYRHLPIYAKDAVNEEFPE